MIEKEIEAMFVALDRGNEDGDFDGVLAAFYMLSDKATISDLPALVAAIQSPRNNFWTRELLSQPVCDLGGVDYLEPLLKAARLGRAEGHDNDGLDSSLIRMAEADPEKCRAKLEEFLARNDFNHRKEAQWLLEFCKIDQSNEIA